MGSDVARIRCRSPVLNQFTNKVLFLARWDFTMDVRLIDRGTQNWIFSTFNFGADVTGLFGYYGKRWFAIGEFGEENRLSAMEKEIQSKLLSFYKNRFTSWENIRIPDFTSISDLKFQFCDAWRTGSIAQNHIVFAANNHHIRVFHALDTDISSSSLF